MSKRRQGSASESLAEALSRVMVTRSEYDHHHEKYDWATTEGRGDRMPRFLERAIEDVPHAAQRTARRSADNVRYEGRSRRLFARVTVLLSSVAVLTGVGFSFAEPERVAPYLDHAKRFARTASVSLASMTFTSSANAATPRLAFGEALRNYSQQAAALEARAPILVSNLAPGTVLSAGEPVTETTWSLPQSELDNLVITFPTNVSAAAMRATVEIPGNTSSSSGKFSVELRQAEQAPAVETSQPTPSSTAPASSVDDDADAHPKATIKAKGESAKRKLKPTAALSPAGNRTATQKIATAASSAKAAAAVATSNATNAASQPAPASVASNEGGSSFLGFLPSLSSSPNALTMFSLGGPALE